QRHFDTVLAILPGEAAPKLALAATDELLLQRMGMTRTPLLEDQVSRATAILNKQMDAVNLSIMSDTWSHITTDPAALRFHAMRLYALVWMTNPTTVSSAFGLARLLVVENQVELAVHVLDRLNASSRHHRMSKLTTIVTLISDDPSESRIRRAARRLEEIPTNEPRLMQVKAAVLSAAFSFLRTHDLDAAASTNPLFEYSFTQTGIREGLSETLRALARTAPFARHRYALVDLANAVRPSTLF
uniref:tetratricopeptide repeat protein n=1 Tax=uncultured Corynebacterium sp. TaxID=159447 RepID=UPI002635A509